MPHIKVIFLWPYARPRGVHRTYVRTYTYTYHSYIYIPPTQLDEPNELRKNVVCTYLCDKYIHTVYLYQVCITQTVYYIPDIITLRPRT